MPHEIYDLFRKIVMQENKAIENSKKFHFDNFGVIKNMDLGMNKMSKAIQVDFEEAIPNYVPLNKYWALLAEYKRAELEDVLQENERLFNLRQILLEINKYFKEILKESNSYVSLQKEVEEDGHDIEVDVNVNKSTND